MKVMLLAAAMSAASFVAMPAAAEVYGQINAGVSLGTADVEAAVDSMTGSGDVDLAAGWLASAAIGNSFDNGVRLESEFLFSGNDVDEDVLEDELGDIEVSQWAFLGNVIYDFKTNSSFKPYVGAGVGLGRTKIDVSELGDTGDSGLVWQLKAGVSIASSETVTWDIGYRFMRMAEISMSDGADSLTAQPDLHVLGVGARMVIGE